MSYDPSREIRVGDVVVASVRRPHIDHTNGTASLAKPRPAVVVGIRKRGEEYMLMGLTSLATYSDGNPRVPVVDWEMIPLDSPGYLWGEKCVFVPKWDILDVIGFCPRRLAVQIVQLATLMSHEERLSFLRAVNAGPPGNPLSSRDDLEDEVVEPDPRFPNRPTHPDFVALSRQVMARDKYLDGAPSPAERNERIYMLIAEFIDFESLDYMTRNRALMGAGDDDRIAVLMQGAMIDGFVMGAKYQRERDSLGRDPDRSGLTDEKGDDNE